MFEVIDPERGEANVVIEATRQEGDETDVEDEGDTSNSESKRKVFLCFRKLPCILKSLFNSRRGVGDR